MHPIRGKVVIIGTILHDDSILNNIIHPKKDSDTPNLGWETIKFPILQNGKSAWASRFPLKKIEQISGTLKANGLDNEFYQEYMCAAIDPNKVLFKREYFRYFDYIEFDTLLPPTSINITDAINTKEIYTRRAKFIKFGDQTIDIAKCRRFSTIDLASATGADETVITTFAIDDKNRIFLLDISLGHWTPFEKSVEIIRVFLTFMPHRIGIERAGMQNDFFYTIDVISKLTGINLPIDALTHGGKAKNLRISNLEPYYRTGQIYHNASQTTTSELEAQLATFDPEVESRSDDIMDAASYLLGYIARSFFDEPNSDEFESDEPLKWV